MASVQRILVYLQRSSETAPIQALFRQSILDTLGCLDDQRNVYAHLADSKLIISDKPQTCDHSSVLLKRPSFCPIHHLSPEDTIKLPEATTCRGIDVGVCTLVESSDGYILLTRRAKHLATFPGIWVPPGGHVEENESLHAAGLRELCEETGLSLSADQCAHNTIPILALWESVFPPMLSMGLPRRHHAVIYLYVQLKPPHTAAALNTHIKCDPGEVGACAWVDLATVQAIVAATEGGSRINPEILLDQYGAAQTFEALVMQSDCSVTTEQLPTHLLLQQASDQDNDRERVSTGTKFALSEWLKHKGLSS